MSEEAQDRQHAATGKHLSELRRQGTVLRSRDLSGGLVFISGVILLITMSSQFLALFKTNFTLSFTHYDLLISNPDHFMVVIKQIIMDSFYQVLPIMIVLFVVTLLSPFLFGGWNFTLDVLQFKLSKLNPANNLGRLFTPKRALIEISKSMIKSSLLLIVLIFYFISTKNSIIALIDAPVSAGIYSTYLMVKSFIIVISGALIFIVLFDAVIHYFEYQEQSKMSTQQVKDEHKEMEGNPEAKRKIRAKQMAIVLQRISQFVPKANVIITNPTHYSVALQYESGKDLAPRVVAKGKGPLAAQIKRIAIANAVTLYEAPQLARAIYFTTKVGAPIHPELYKAVAMVLSYVYQLKNYQMGNSKLPEFVSHFDLPKEFIFNDDAFDGDL